MCWLIERFEICNLKNDCLILLQNSFITQSHVSLSLLTTFYANICWNKLLLWHEKLEVLQYRESWRVKKRKLKFCSSSATIQKKKYYVLCSVLVSSHTYHGYRTLFFERKRTKVIKGTNETIYSNFLYVILLVTLTFFVPLSAFF